MPEIAPAIAMLLPILAADAGRARGDTLLMIQGAGPDYVRKQLAAIDAALGAGSPGIAALTDLIDESERAVATSRPTVAHQHVISEAVIRKFVRTVPPTGRVVARVDLASGQLDLAAAGSVGYVDDFVPVDSKATEGIWHLVETRLFSALKAARGGTALGNAVHLSTLRNVVALHFVRNPQTLTVHNKSFADALDKHVDQVAQTELAAEAFRRRYGFEPAGPVAMRLGAEASQEHLVRLHKEGGLFRLSVQRLYEKVCDRFETRGVEILTPANPDKKFLLGDVPAITVTTATGAFGLSQGVAVDDADKIVMPLTPRLLVAIGPPNGSRSIGDTEVDSYNKMGIREARDYVLHLPGADFAAEIAGLAHVKFQPIASQK